MNQNKTYLTIYSFQDNFLLSVSWVQRPLDGSKAGVVVNG